MDFASVMSNPMAQQMMARIQQDPELMSLLSRPDIMERFQGMMANPQAAANDPEMQSIMQRMIGGAAGGGGMGMGGFGGGGGFEAPPPQGANPWAAASQSQAGGGESLVSIHSAAQYHQAIKDAGAKLVVADFTASWCGPCRRIAPVFAELSAQYRGKVIFLKIDGDENRQLAQDEGVTGFPTFFFIVNGVKIDQFSGADERRLRQIVSEYGDREDVPVNPYKHFPLKDTESVKYLDIKWELIDSKLTEYNNSGKLNQSQKLSELERADVDVIIQKLSNKANYHSSAFTESECVLMEKLLLWPSDCIGPVLNLWRIYVSHPHTAQYYTKKLVDSDSNSNLISQLLKVLSSTDKPVTALLVIRIFVNCFIRRSFAKSLISHSEEILDTVSVTIKKFDTDENLRASICALYVNFTIVFSENSATYEAPKVQLLSSMPDNLALSKLSNKTVYSLLVVLGSLIYNDRTLIEMANALELNDSVDRAQKDFASDGQVQAVADEVKRELRKQ